MRDLLRRCLQKDTERRLHDIADARLEIEDAATEPPRAAGASRVGAGRWAPMAPARGDGGGLGVRGGLLAWRIPRSAPPRDSPQVQRLARLTHPTSRAEWPSWSPDGSLLAYASDRSGNYEIYVRRGETGQDVNVTNDPAQDIQPAFSPDGNSIAFISTRASRTGLIKIGGVLARNSRTYGGDLWIAPALGGAARRLASNANSPAWRPDGKGILYISGPEGRRSLLEVSPNGGAPRPVLSEEKSVFELVRIAASPDGRWLSFETQLEGIFLMPAGGGEPRNVLTGFSHSWDGVLAAPLLRVPGRAGRKPRPVRRDRLREGAVGGAPTTISLMIAALWDLAVSRDGLQIAVAEEAASRNLTRLRLDPEGGTPVGAEEPLSTGRVTDAYPSVSPDGRRVAYTSDVLGRTEIWILDIESGQRSRLQLPGEDLVQIGPAWMPDGRRIILTRLLPANMGSNWIVSLDGSGSEELVRAPREGLAGTLAAGPDGKSILYTKAVRGVQQFFSLDLSLRQSVQMTHSPDTKFDAIWSPDGRSIAVTASQGGATQLFRMPASGGRMQQLTTGYERMRHPFFSPDGRWIYVQPSHRNIYRVRAEGGPLEPVTRFPEAGLFLEEPTISPDGRYLYYCRSNGGSSLWLMTLGRASAPGGTQPPP